MELYHSIFFNYFLFVFDNIICITFWRWNTSSNIIGYRRNIFCVYWIILYYYMYLRNDSICPKNVAINKIDLEWWYRSKKMYIKIEWEAIWVIKTDIKYISLLTLSIITTWISFLIWILLLAGTSNYHWDSLSMLGSMQQWMWTLKILMTSMCPLNIIVCPQISGSWPYTYWKFIMMQLRFDNVNYS